MKMNDVRSELPERTRDFAFPLFVPNCVSGLLKQILGDHVFIPSRQSYHLPARRFHCQGFGFKNLILAAPLTVVGVNY
jgi:hypothetical protein